MSRFDDAKTDVPYTAITVVYFVVLRSASCKIQLYGGIWLETACKPSSLSVLAASNCHNFWGTEADSWKPEV